MSIIKRQLNKERRIDDLMHGRISVPGFTPWEVDKQVIAVPPEDGSKELIVHGKNYEYVDFSWPRMIRVTITNGMQVHLIGDSPLGAMNETRFNRLVAEAEEQVSFLNAHEVR